MDTLQLQGTARMITSKPVQRAVVNTVLLVSSALTLLGLASIATALFFQNHVPHQLLSTSVHLQYGSGLNPFGIVSLTSPALKSCQDYDISVTLSMPRSPPNVERGNFMVSLHLLDRDISTSLVAIARKSADKHVRFENHTILYSSRRAALIPHLDPIVSHAKRVFFLFYYMLIPSSQAIELVVPLAERVSFSKGSVVPSSAYLELEGGQTIQTYHTTLNFVAKLGGLRWLMFHYRLPTYLTFTFLFWCCELLFTVGAWSLWSVLMSPPHNGVYYDNRGKRRLENMGEEEEGTSDHAHTFPTYGKSPPLKYEPKVKDEEEYEQSLSELPIAGAEADDEDDYKDRGSKSMHDSGIGTSYSEEGSSNVRRRGGR